MGLSACGAWHCGRLTNPVLPCATLQWAGLPAGGAAALGPPADSAPQAAWSCPHLTSLLCIDADNIAVADGTYVQCTGLRQLQFDGCTFSCGFPEQLCSALYQLSSLAMVGTRLEGLPPAFSRLRCAGFGWPTLTLHAAFG